MLKVEKEWYHHWSLWYHHVFLLGSELTDLFFHNLASLRSLISTPTVLCVHRIHGFLYQMPWQDLETHQHYIHCHQLTVILVLQAAFLLSQWNVSYKSCIGYVFNICYSSLTHKFLEIFTKTRKKRNQFIKWKFLLLICL